MSTKLDPVMQKITPRWFYTCVILLIILFLFTCEIPPMFTVVEVIYPGQFWVVIRNVETGSLQIIYGEERLHLVLDNPSGRKPDRMRITVTKTSFVEFVDRGLLTLVVGDLRDEAPFGDAVAELEFLSG